MHKFQVTVSASVESAAGFSDVLFRASGEKVAGGDMGDFHFDAQDVAFETDEEGGALFTIPGEFRTNAADFTQQDAQRYARFVLKSNLAEIGADLFR